MRILIMVHAVNDEGVASDPGNDLDSLLLEHDKLDAKAMAATVRKVLTQRMTNRGFKVDGAGP